MIHEPPTNARITTAQINTYCSYPGSSLSQIEVRKKCDFRGLSVGSKIYGDWCCWGSVWVREAPWNCYTGFFSPHPKSPSKVWTDNITVDYNGFEKYEIWDVLNRYQLSSSDYILDSQSWHLSKQLFQFYEMTIMRKEV